MGTCCGKATDSATPPAEPAEPLPTAGPARPPVLIYTADAADVAFSYGTGQRGASKADRIGQRGISKADRIDPAVAIAVQSAWRGFSARKGAEYETEYLAAAAAAGPPDVSKADTKLERAALAAQSAWRGFSARKGAEYEAEFAAAAAAAA